MRSRIDWNTYFSWQPPSNKQAMRDSHATTWSIFFKPRTVSWTVHLPLVVYSHNRYGWLGWSHFKATSLGEHLLAAWHRDFQSLIWLEFLWWIIGLLSTLPGPLLHLWMKYFQLSVLLHINEFKSTSSWYDPLDICVSSVFSSVNLHATT